MKRSVRAITISGNGINCEIETAFAFTMAGAEVSDIVHISRIVTGEVRLDDYHILALAGGFPGWGRPGRRQSDGKPGEVRHDRRHRRAAC